MAQNVTILAPDGTPGDVPAANVPAALAAGGKIGIHVYAPDGTAGYVPHDKLGDALKAGATYSGQQQAPDDRNFIQKAVDQAASPDSPATTAARGPLSNYLNSFGRGATETLLSPVVHPVNTIMGIGQAIAHTGYNADPKNPLAQTIMGVGQDLRKNGVDALPHIAGQVAGGAALGELGNAVVARFLPAPTNLSPAEIASRGVAKSVLPKEGDFNAFTDALQREKGNVDQFASQQGLTTRTPLDTSIAARQSADSLGDFYRDKLLGPVADQSVPVPAKFDQVGSTAPSGSQYATLRQIDQRINDLNDIIRPARNNATQGATATDLANLQQVVAEHDALVNILHNKLGAAAGVDPSVIAGVRQSIGARAELADQLGASANRSTLKAGQVDRTGSSISKPTVASTIIDAINKLRGGPEAIANRSFQKAYPTLDVPSNIGNPATIEELRTPGIAQYLSKR